MQLKGILTKCSKGKDVSQTPPSSSSVSWEALTFSPANLTTQSAHVCPLHCEELWLEGRGPYTGVPHLICDGVFLNTHILIVVVINFKPQATARLYKTKCSVLMKRWETQAVQMTGNQS